MHVAAINIERDIAREHYDRYRKHGGKEAADIEIQNAYYQLSQGRTVIRALESIRLAGLNADGLPKLTIARATAARSFLTLDSDGGAAFKDRQWLNGRNHRRNAIRMPPGSFPPGRHRVAEAILPMIPPDVRPRHHLDTYHILWEAEWRPVPPGDPYLLRRIGHSDMWVVLAAWDLTEVEKAAMATRIMPN